MAALFLSEEAGSTSVEGVVEGDDGLFSIEGPAPTTEDFAELGMIIKLEQHTDLCKASFCGIIFDPVDMVNIACPRKIMATFGWASSRYRRSRPEILKALLRCKALSLLAQYPGAPIIQSLALFGLRATGDVRKCKMLRAVNMRGGLDEWHRTQVLAALDMKIEPQPVPARTRDLMAEVFGVTVHDQFVIEAYLDAQDELVPLKIDPSMFPESWRWYAENYVTADHGDFPVLSTLHNGLNVYSLFYRVGGKLHSTFGDTTTPPPKPPPTRLARDPCS